MHIRNQESGIGWSSCAAAFCQSVPASSWGGARWSVAFAVPVQPMWVTTACVPVASWAFRGHNQSSPGCMWQKIRPRRREPTRTEQRERSCHCPAQGGWHKNRIPENSGKIHEQLQFQLMTTHFPEGGFTALQAKIRTETGGTELSIRQRRNNLVARPARDYS